MTTIHFPPLIAHRGASRYAPENTLTALRLAHDLGATWVECDLRLTRDQQAVVFHDATLQRCTDGHGRIRTTTYAALTQLDAGSWFGSQFHGETIPTLARWLQLAAQLKLHLNLELKSNPQQAHRLAEELIHQLNLHWPKTLASPLISSSRPNSLAIVKQLAPHLPLALIAARYTPRAQHIALALGCRSFHTDQQTFTLTALEQLKTKKQPLAVLLYTINNRSLAEKWLAAGVDSIFSDDPQLLITPGPTHESWKRPLFPQI